MQYGFIQNSCFLYLWIIQKCGITVAMSGPPGREQQLVLCLKYKKMMKQLDFGGFFVIIEMMFLHLRRRCIDYEDDISAQEEVKSKSSWIPCQNEHQRRKKSIGCKKIKRKKKIISLGHIICGLSSSSRGFKIGLFRIIEEKPGFPECI